MQVTIFGPNLRDQSKGQFLAHAAGCADCAKLAGEYAYTIEAATKLDVSADLHQDILSDYGLTEDDPEGRAKLIEWLSEIHFFPCVTLPTGAALPGDQS